MPSGGDFRFGPFRLDPLSRRLFRATTPIPLQPRQFDLLHLFVSRPGELLTKDQLIQTVWQGVAVGDNSLAQAISQLRTVLDSSDPARYIETVARLGYRFVAPVERIEAEPDPPRADLDLNAMFEAHRMFTDGRVALETLGRDQVARARTTFEWLVRHQPHDARCHVGLAIACALSAESVRADRASARDAVQEAITHGREACRLAPENAAAWDALGLALMCAGQTADALAAHARAVALDPDHWRYQVGYAHAAWGEDRLAAVRRALKKMPGLAMARWLGATVYVARGALDEAEREIDAGLAAMTGESGSAKPFSAIGLHWLKGLLCLARGADDDALAAFDRERALESCGHLYAREMAASTWVAIGACRLRRGEDAAARAAFDESLARVPDHAMARAGLAILNGCADAIEPPASASFDHAAASAALHVARGDVAGAVELVTRALEAAPPGATGWRLPIEPLLYVQRTPDAWAIAQVMLRSRAM